jgi:hypothetical protein
MRMDLYDLGKVGVISDLPGHTLPPEAWTDALNVRFNQESINSRLGHRLVYNPNPVPPAFILPVQTATEFFWLYTSLTKAYCISGQTHTDITRTSGGDYTASSYYDWNGCVFSGIPIVNNGADDPQYWNNAAPVNPLAVLPDWPANTKAKIIRAYKNFLFALNVTEASVRYPHRVRWSDAAGPGSLPTSWDYTDPTVLTGARELTDPEAGEILDGYQLQDAFIVYKQNSIWIFRLTAGDEIFSSFQYSNMSGLLAPKCFAAGPKGTSHIIVSPDDILLFNLGSLESIVDRRIRKQLFDEIDPASVNKCFAYSDNKRSEFHFCYAPKGSDNVSKSLMWNWKDNTFTFDDFRGECAALGPVELSISETQWNSDEADVSWADYEDTWSGGNAFNSREVLVGDFINTKMYLMNSGSQLEGADIPSYLERIGLPFVGRARDGSPKADLYSMKCVNRVWPKITGSIVNIRIGVQADLSAPIEWTAPIPFVPGTDTYIEPDSPVTGKLIAFRIECDGDGDFQCDGIDYDFEIVGEF